MFIFRYIHIYVYRYIFVCVYVSSIYICLVMLCGSSCF